MRLADNPYSPGAGLRPAVLAGREPELEAFEAILQRGELGRSLRGLMVTGLRGVGKTVLVNEFARAAVARDWIVVQLEVRPGGDTAMLSGLAARLQAELGLRGKASTALKRALRSITAFSLTVDPGGSIGASVERATGVGGDLELDFASLAVDVGAAALESGVGVAVFIDEMQELDKSVLASVAAAAHAAGQRTVPFVVVGAGLPNLPGRLADAKSYAERLFEYRPLGKLDPATAAAALIGPAAEGGVSWEPAALRRIVGVSGGYPYFLQEFGAATWNVAAGPVITAHDAENGKLLGSATLDAGFFRARWERATPIERRYLRAMADDGGAGSRTQDVAARLDRSQSALGPTRAGLIGKGLVYAPEFGVVAFTTPAMSDFIRRQHDD
ncbi:ATP-binding protein [Jatrophihabitans sp.]|uniref:ATP-binding protein n=1 Tax=Jatrophihabitans sp. TaxID=1932789 RepID=UPI0030C784D4|nr:hypothetical protein [Jatrophihabitans sp.]